MVISRRKAASLSFGDFTDDALNIANTMLSRTGAAILSGDFDDFAQCLALPHRLETFEGVNILTTREDIEAVFIGIRRHHVGKSVTDMIRHCLSAEFDGADRVKFTHETRLMNGTYLVQDSFPCLSTVERVEGRWLITECSYAIVNVPQHVKALMGRLGHSSASAS